MVFNHVVKFGGKYYKAGEDVPMEQGKKSPVPSSSEEKPVEKKRRGRPPQKQEQ